MPEKKNAHLNPSSSILLGEMDDLLSSYFNLKRPVMGSAQTWKPPMDVFTSEGKLVILMEISGIKQDRLYLELQDHLLIIRGIREELKSFPNRNYHKMEVDFGPFQRRLKIPFTVLESEVTARYTDGFLQIVIPVKNEDLGDQIPLELE